MRIEFFTVFRRLSAEIYLFNMFICYRNMFFVIVDCITIARVNNLKLVLKIYNKNYIHTKERDRLQQAVKQFPCGTNKSLQKYYWMWLQLLFVKTVVLALVKKFELLVLKTCNKN
ncbi:uncharacterized protein LOC105206674 [Solenopsis invicta]|uniref:uncharacterized protein LOC105206674 n=1 Tax=Solenopsis invicta TaxID=13686 RepID=UPI0005961FB8|nr:uncharacterized protein LOC105206674 [Solenopsis invicta]